MEQDLNRTLIESFYTRVLGAVDIEYANTIISENYIQHNPHVKNGKAGILEALAFLKEMPKPENPENPFKRIISDGTFGAAYFIVEVLGKKKAVLDLIRIQNGLLVEHWDAIQEVDKASSLNNIMLTDDFEIRDLNLTEQNKSIIENYSKRVLIERDFELKGEFISTDLVHYYPTDINGSSGLEELYEDTKVQTLHRVIGEGNLVVTQASGFINNEAHVLYDMYSLAHGKIEKHWSICQAIPEMMAHTNGMI